MCGIYISVHNLRNDKQCACKINHVPDQLTLLTNRGPDNNNTRLIIENNVTILAISTVLHQRGPINCLAQQPLVDEGSNVLLWNGEIFGGIDIKPENNDTRVMLELLANSKDENDILNVIGQIQGPWAFIFWSHKSKQLWFGRDILGRRSLVYKITNLDDCSNFLISSVTDGLKGWEEVPTQGILCLDLSESVDNLSLKSYEWSLSPSGSKLQPNKLSFIPILDNPRKISIPIREIFNSSLVQPKSDDTLQDYISLLYGLEKNSGLKCFNNLSNISKTESITLLELLIDSQVFDECVYSFFNVLKEAVDIRVNSQPFLCINCSKITNVQDCLHPSVGILFSGGVDCMVLAALTDLCLKNDLPIDLMNVSFQHYKGRKSQSSKNKSIIESPEMSFESPDRLTGIEGYKELIRVCPNRKWNFVEINVHSEELKEARDSRIKHLIHPSETVLDDSIGCAIWFAAKGQGKLVEAHGNATSYTSPTRVILLGMGADEQLGGYSRHRQKFLSGGWDALKNEIILEIDRISSRNLGRDDRIISDHGREARFPFLDENVVSFLNSVPIHKKLNLELPRGVGEKLLLRMLAYKLKLKSASVLPKRAIQFGSRIANAEGKEKGADLCKRL